MLISWFKTYPIDGHTLRKAISFFISASIDAGLPISNSIKKMSKYRSKSKNLEVVSKTSHISPTSNFIIGVGFGFNTFVAAGTLGNFLRSTDNGSSFDNATSPTANQLRGVGF